MVYIGNLTSK